MSLSKEELYYSKWVITTLQESALGVQSQLRGSRLNGDGPKQLRTSLNFILAGLMQIRQLVQSSLLTHADASMAASQVSAKVSRSTAALHPPEANLEHGIRTVLLKLIKGGHLPQTFHVPRLAEAPEYIRSFQKQVDLEIRDVSSFCSQLAPAAGNKHLSHLRLPNIIHSLRSLEQGVDLQARIAAEVELLSKATGYTDDNFAYGSTPFITWHKVISQAPVAAKLLASNPGIYMVWGSSLGWLLFYVATAFDVTCVGYELLSSLAGAAAQVAKDYSLGNVEVHAADMLSSSLLGVDVLVLTNQCWDDDLMQCCADKIMRELPQGAVCIEYTGALQTPLGAPFSKLACPVSWNSQQHIYTYIKNDSPATLVG